MSVAALAAVAAAPSSALAAQRSEGSSLSPAGGVSAPVVAGPEAKAPVTAAQRDFAVGIRTVRIADPTRTVQLPGGRRAPRTLLTYILYPAAGQPGGGELRDAPPPPGSGPFPLVVFAHGFAVTPATYTQLLQSWVKAGYVVAAPVFPRSSAGAPGGPNESDVVNQPRDVSVVISKLLADSAAAGTPLSGLLDSTRIAVAGQSDGGETALAVAYARRMRDVRVRAAIVLSGAEMSGVGGYSFSPGRPALLAVQGTADTTNEPRFTYAYFRSAHRPKYLLRLLGAGHLPPYTSAQPYLAIVERVSTAFLDGYLNSSNEALQRLPGLGTAPGRAALSAGP